jgi:hypothetical protein
VGRCFLGTNFPFTYVYSYAISAVRRVKDQGLSVASAFYASKGIRVMELVHLVAILEKHYDTKVPCRWLGYQQSFYTFQSHSFTHSAQVHIY